MSTLNQDKPATQSGGLKLIGEVKSKHGTRHLVMPEDIQYGRKPDWFRRLLNTKNAEVPFDRPWFDHPGRWQDSLTLEPYGLESDDIRELADLCSANKLDYHISPCSEWYPTQTLLIRIWSQSDYKWKRVQK